MKVKFKTAPIFIKKNKKFDMTKDSKECSKFVSGNYSKLKRKKR